MMRCVCAKHRYLFFPPVRSDGPRKRKDTKNGLVLISYYT